MQLGLANITRCKSIPGIQKSETKNVSNNKILYNTVIPLKTVSICIQLLVATIKKSFNNYQLSLTQFIAIYGKYKHCVNRCQLCDNCYTFYMTSQRCDGGEITTAIVYRMSTTNSYKFDSSKTSPSYSLAAPNPSKAKGHMLPIYLCYMCYDCHHLSHKTNT